MPPEGTSRLRDEQKLLIVELAQQDDPELGVEDIWKQVTTAFPRSNYYHPPALGTVRNRVGKARKSRIAQDERWSIGVSGQMAIPIEAMKDVVEVWEYVLLHYGRYITLRQAKWIARLGDLITEKEFSDSREERRYKWASLYAGREKAALTLNLKLDTSDMDASLLIKGDVYSAVVATGLADQFTDASRLNDLALSDRNLALEELALRRQVDLYLEMSPEEARRQGRARAEFSLDHEAVYFDAIPDENSVTEEQRRRAIEQIEEAIKVCGVWRLAIMRDGKQWPEITEQRRKEITLELAKKSVEHHVFDNWANPISFEDLLARGNFRPSEQILKEVGYEPPHESEVRVAS